MYPIKGKTWWAGIGTSINYHCCCFIFLKSGFMYTHVMLILINQCLLNVVFSMTKALNGQNSPKQNFPSRRFQCYLENPACLDACFPHFSNPFFIWNFIRTTSLTLGLENLNISGGSEYIWKWLDIFLKLFYFGLFKNLFRQLIKSVKFIWKLIFLKYLVVEQDKFHVLNIFYHPFHFMFW